MASRVSVALKALGQLGLTQVALYALYRFGLITGHYRRTTSVPDSQKSNTELSSIVPLFSLPDRAQLAQTLGEDGQHALLAEADEIVAGKFRMFGDEPVEIKLTLDQHLRHWTDYETGKAPIPESQFPIRDIKFLWEPARFGWAFTLGRAYRLTQNETYAETFWHYFETFTEANPPNLGPHWMNGQEVAVRLMALVWASQVFGTSPIGGGEILPANGGKTVAASSVERHARLAQSIAAHAARIPPTLVYARAQNNNHLVTEAAALYTAGRALDRVDWHTLGWRWLNWAFRHQISSYGEYIQHSVNYHRVMLQSALWVDAIKDADWPRLTFQSLGRATHWLFSMLDPASGRTPNLGANDGALILPLSVTPFNDFRPTVQAAARAFLRYQMPGGTWDELSLWLGLGAHEKAYDPSLYLTDHPRGRESWAYLRASTFPSRLGHMDQLHLDLWWRGLNVAQDAGTYLYNADPPWDNPLVSTRVHNTVTVDDHGQMTRGGRFMTLDWFPAYSKNMVPIDESILGQVTGYHHGYPGVRHERTVTVFADERWLVEDELSSDEPHIYRLHWLLPDWEWEVENWDSGFGIRIKSPLGWITLHITTDSQFPGNNSQLALIRAGELVYGTRDVQTFEGWVSPTYGQKTPALLVTVETSNVSNASFSTEFIFPS